jgi:hypothetical protein
MKLPGAASSLRQTESLGALGSILPQKQRFTLARR